MEVFAPSRPVEIAMTRPARARRTARPRMLMAICRAGRITTSSARACGPPSGSVQNNSVECYIRTAVDGGQSWIIQGSNVECYVWTLVTVPYTWDANGCDSDGVECVHDFTPAAQC